MLRRSLALALSLALLAPVLPLGAAHAADPVSLPETGLVALVPVGEVMGDGTTAVLVPVVALDGAGVPIPGLQLKPEASAGTASNWKELSPGVYSFEYVPPAVTAAQRVSLSAGAKVVGRGFLTGSLEVEVKPPVSSKISITPKPETLTLGKSEGATLLVESTRIMMARASSGEVGEITDLGTKKTARYTPPKVNFPQLGIVTFADEADPGRIIGSTVLKLEGAVSYPVTTTPKASVVLKIGEKEYGPVVAGDDGKAAVPIVVPPGVQKAKMIATVDGKPTESDLDLKIPATKRVVLVPLPKVVPADGSLVIPLRAVVAKPTGEPDTEAKPTFTASSGKVGAVVHEGNGVYRADWSPGDADAAGTVTLEVKLADKVDVDTLEVQTSPRRVKSLTVTSPTEPPKDSSFVVTLKAEGGTGGMAGKKLTVSATGATVKGTQEKGNGEYEVALIKTEGELTLDAFVGADFTDNPLRYVVVVPGTEKLANDGASATTITVATVDGLGYPVPGVTVSLALENGDGKLAEKSVTTDEFGLARVEYTAGSAATMVRVRGTSGATSGAAGLLQVPAKTAALDLPAGGTAAARAVLDSWARTALEWRPATPAAPAAAEAPVAAAVDLAPADADAKTIEVFADPTTVRPGGKVLVEVKAKAEDGKPIPGQTLDFLTSSGTFGEIKETNGTYASTLTVGSDATGEVKVSIIAPSGAMQLVKLTVDPKAPLVAKTGPAEEAPAKEPEPKVVKEPKVKEPKAAAAPTERPWLRIGVKGLGSTYRYEQAPSTEPGPLLPQSLAVGGSAGSPATPVGGELEARGWLESLPYVGFHGMFRASGYSIESSAFNEPAPDTLLNVQVDAAGRYPFEVGSDVFWVGGKVGFHYNDFMIFQGCLEPGCEIEYGPLGLAGLGLGAEMGAEISKLFFVAGYTQGLANFSVPYSNTVDVNVGYQIIPNAFADIGFTSVSRKVLLNGADSGLERGTLSDSQLLFKVGGGVSF